MNTFVDTSAFLAFLDKNEQNHAAARKIWIRLSGQDASLFCTSYILSETAALVQNRLGMSQLRTFHDNVFPFLHVIWIDWELHNAGMRATLNANRRQLSLVDCISFITMHRFGLTTVFAFDEHFVEQGFTVLE